MTILFYWYVIGWVVVGSYGIEFDKVTLADFIVAMGLGPILILLVVIMLLPFNYVYEALKKCDRLVLWRKG